MAQCSVAAAQRVAPAMVARASPPRSAAGVAAQRAPFFTGVTLAPRPATGVAARARAAVQVVARATKSQQLQVDVEKPLGELLGGGCGEGDEGQCAWCGTADARSRRRRRPAPPPPPRARTGLQLEQGPNGLTVKSSSGNAAKAGIERGDTVIYTSSFFGDELWPSDKLGARVGMRPAPVCSLLLLLLLTPRARHPPRQASPAARSRPRPRP